MRIRLRRAIVPVLVLVVALLLVTRHYAAEPLRVSSSSMSPTLHTGDHVVVLKIGRRAHAPHRHDIIVFTRPSSHELLIKRVAATGGDTVGIEDGILVVNGRALHEPYVDASQMDSVYFGPVRVPIGDVFVLGDNRANSTDSRAFGPVPVSRITGRVVLRLWPPLRIWR